MIPARPYAEGTQGPPGPGFTPPLRNATRGRIAGKFCSAYFKETLR
jgi:hypothetical protein